VVDRESEIIGIFLSNKEIDPKSIGLEKQIFKNQNARLVCDQILSGVRDQTEIFEKLKMKSDSIAAYITSCTEGLYRRGTSEERVRELIVAQKKMLLNEKVLRLINEGARRGNYDHDKIQASYGEIKSLDSIADGKRPQVETLREFLSRDLPERQILIDPILGLQEMVMIHGRPKVGKSLLTLQLSRCLITGEDWLGFKVYKVDRPILIIQVEISPNLMQERVKKIFRDVAGTEKIIIPSQSRNIFFDQKDGRQYVLHLIEDFRPGLVILDPYSKFFTDEETALKNPRPFFDFWQEQIETQMLSLLFVHHDAKFQEGKLGGQKALGTTSINASTDGNWSIERIVEVKLDPLEFLRTARLSFESRNWQNIRPLDIRLNDNLTFELTLLPKGAVDEWDIVEEIEKAGGKIEQGKLIKQYSSLKMFYQAKNKALENDLIDEIQLKTKGNPIILMLKKGDTENNREYEHKK